ncbi:MAG: hypothetical protein KJ852_16285 [Gammaproteobacteria bacterium]|nr:hypothetical protein [Gammaproteobacteria bacterium]MBU0786781.1 hypothetical protein [Gammaproteobacteria bacterium]MBU0814013.1 hypothetical protein [Gammaproteobacteria bacterium]MBU1788514.1 hypothetical protein [Gammaproteobacteria bacterium]
MDLKPSRRRVIWTVLLAIAVAGALLFWIFNGPRKPGVIYMLKLSPDASRVAIAKKQEKKEWELFEGNFEKGFRTLRMPAGYRADSSIVYSPDGKYLIFSTTAEVRVLNSSVEKPESGNTGPTILWRQQNSDEGGSTPQKILERSFPITNILPMLDGSLLFMGKVDEIENHQPALVPGSHRTWSRYKWMLSKPDGSISVLNPRGYAFFSTASLIRDEAVFLVQERRVDGSPMDPYEYYLDITTLKPGADLTELERLGNMQDRRGGPRMECDWAGKTCARLMTYTKNGYFAHQLEIIRDGKVCQADGLPDRLEKMSIARAGNAVVLVTRPTPREGSGYKLARVAINADGCAGAKQFFDFPQH